MTVRRRFRSSPGIPRPLGGPRRRSEPAGLRRWLRPERAWWLLTLIGLALLTLYLLRGLLALLIASAALAYLLDPLVDRFEARGWKRESGIVALAVSAALGLALAAALVVPYVAGEFRSLSANLDGYVSALELGMAQRRELIVGAVNDPPGDPAAVRELIEGLLGPGERAAAPAAGEGALQQELDVSGLTALIQERAPSIGRWLTEAGKRALSGGLSFALGVLNLALVPIFTFYLLRDWDKLVAGVDQLVPPRHRERVRRLAGEIDERLSSFVRGQSTVCAILGVLYAIGLALVGIDMAVAVGMLSGLLFIIPYLGTVVGVVVASALALLKFGFSWHILGVWATYGLVQLIEGSLLTPSIVGDKVGLHPMVVMIALLVGGNLLGIWGMLVAIPITAAAWVLLAEWHRGYRASHFFEGRDPP